jgi:hypothetical protein
MTCALDTPRRLSASRLRSATSVILILLASHHDAAFQRRAAHSDNHGLFLAAEATCFPAHFIRDHHHGFQHLEGDTGDGCIEDGFILKEMRVNVDIIWFE